MLSMKVSTLRCSYLNKSNRVGLVPRGLHYRTKHGYEKGKSSREDRIFKVGVEKSSGREREGERKRGKSVRYISRERTQRSVWRPFSSAKPLLGQPCPLLHGNPTSFLFSRQKATRFELATGHSIPETTVQYLSANGRE